MNTIKELSSSLEQEIKKSSDIFIIGHNGPDFDSIGSAIGLYNMANHYNKKAYIVVDDEDSKLEAGVKAIIDETKDTIKYVKKSDVLEKVNSKSLLLVTDTNKKNMIALGDSLDKFKRVFVIDHHGEDKNTISTEYSYIDLGVSSASEIVARILSYCKVPYDSSISNYLFAGISLDTKRFKINTTDATHDIARRLIRHGANIDYVNSLSLQAFDSYCRISSLIINGTVIMKYSESLIAPIQVSFTINRNAPSTIYAKEDYAKAADQMMKFQGIDASFALGYVEEGIVHISARGTKKVNVGNIMKSVGGGGNPQSAGGRIKTDDIFSLEQQLKDNVSLGLADNEELKEEPITVKVKQLKKKKKEK